VSYRVAVPTGVGQPPDACARTDRWESVATGGGM